VDEDRAVRLEHQEPSRLRQRGSKTTGVDDFTTSHDQAHGRWTVLSVSDNPFVARFSLLGLEPSYCTRKPRIAELDYVPQDEPSQSGLLILVEFVKVECSAIGESSGHLKEAFLQEFCEDASISDRPRQPRVLEQFTLLSAKIAPTECITRFSLGFPETHDAILSKFGLLTWLCPGCLPEVPCPLRCIEFIQPSNLRVSEGFVPDNTRHRKTVLVVLNVRVNADDRKSWIVLQSHHPAP